MPTFEQYLAWRVVVAEPALELDLSDAGLDADTLTSATPKLQAALQAMRALEAGALANPDEGRRVGHYWLRAPELAPEPAITAEIHDSWMRIDSFAAGVRDGVVTAHDGQPFRDVLLIGIGGSALGPALLVDALGREVRVLLDRSLAAGQQAYVGFTTAGLPAGVYVARLQTARGAAALQFTVVR